ncbi:hypothetical protein AGLY_010087 [Aphis glycines]|uniref:Uncharacterized protein n=1 Tax=Aphis glycines TaxID=307491 RepID=A0A6G0TFE5_APHGL|nr:hypothetical protein AGLY_010087 [Aphis glycines]
MITPIRFHLNLLTLATRPYNNLTTFMLYLSSHSTNYLTYSDSPIPKAMFLYNKLSRPATLKVTPVYCYPLTLHYLLAIGSQSIRHIVRTCHSAMHNINFCTLQSTYKVKVNNSFLLTLIQSQSIHCIIVNTWLFLNHYNQTVSNFMKFSKTTYFDQSYLIQTLNLSIEPTMIL